MANYLNLTSYRDLEYGPLVTKTSQVIPTTNTASLYTVATGNVLVTSIFGVTTTPATAATATLALGVITSAATANTSIATATALGTVVTGSWVTTQSSSGKSGALVVGTTSAISVFQPVQFVVPPGQITWTTSAAATGTFTWYLTYVPLDNGANVT